MTAPGPPAREPRPGAPTARSTARRVHPPPASEPEVVVSIGGSGEPPPQVHRRGSVLPALQGPSLRWKIVASMGGMALATAVLVFFAASSTTVGLLNDAINNKGVRLVKTLAAMDPGYWRYAMNQSVEDRRARLDGLIQRAFQWESSSWRDVLSDVDISRLYKSVLLPLGEDKREAGKELLTRLFNVLDQKLEDPQQKQRLRKDFDTSQQDPAWQADFRTLVSPLGDLLEPLKGLQDVGEPFDVVNLAVQDIHPGSHQGVAAVQGHIVRYHKTPQVLDGVKICDGMIERTGTPVRMFTLDHPPGPYENLRFSALLSRVRIDQDVRALRNAILLPIFVSVVLATGIAVGLSRLITRPIHRLLQDIVEVSRGNLAHQTVPVSRDEVGLLAATFNKMTLALRKAHTQELEAKALEHDLVIASEIQSNLVPKRMLKIPGYDIGAYYRPSKEVGGDYYDFIAIDEDNEALVVADVSGKGVPGALVMSMFRTLIRMEAVHGRNTSPTDTLAKVNRMLAPDIKKGMFVTALYGILNTKTNELRVSSAGHNPLLVWRAAVGEVQVVNPSGIALGFDSGSVFEKSVREEKVLLGHGDRVVAYTDGVVEAMDGHNREFSDEWFRSFIQKMATRDSNQLLNLLIQEIDAHRGAAPQSDDITVVTLRYL